MEPNSGIKNKPFPNAPFFQEVERFLQEKMKVTIYVQGGSMRPFLRNGDKVLLAPIVYRKLFRGDIVLARTPFGMLLHRVVRMRQEDVWLAGDANSKQLEHITRDHIIGVVEKAWRMEKPININSCLMRVSAFFWYLLRPFRGYILGIYYRLKRIKEKRK